MADDGSIVPNGDVCQDDEKMFLLMTRRRQNRILYGPVLKKTNNTLMIGWALLFGIIIAQGYSTEQKGDEKSTKISIELNDAIFFLISAFAILLTILISSSYHFRMFVIWFFLLNPIGHVALSLSIYQDVDFNDHKFLLYTFIGCTVLIYVTYVFAIFIMPFITNSTWLGKTGFARWFWSLRLKSDFEMTYKSKPLLPFSRRNICSYKGQTDSKGLPHGQGTWYDFSYNGEILEGTWCHGEPIAPFTSREYGTGSVTEAIPIVLYIATDDEFDHSSTPSNENEVKVAVVGVECCVMGNFYNNFPVPSLITEPKVMEGDTPIGDLCKNMLDDHDTKKENISSITIRLSKPNGLQVKGFRYNPTGFSSCYNADQLNIIVHNLNYPQIDNASVLFRGERNPRRNSIPFPGDLSQILKSVPEDEKDEENQNTPRSLTNGNGEEDNSEPPVKHSNEKPYFEIENWSPRVRKDALIFFPGFNSCPKKSSANFGQLLAMTELCKYVYPILFCWPNGTILKYRKSSKLARSKKNVENFVSLLKDLQKSGIQNVHLLSHSMGAQAMLQGFNCEEDGTRSEVSRCFKLVENFNPGEKLSKKLICKSITLMNPDYPLCAFIDETFHSIRKVCSNITLIGDRMDQALMYSQYINGVTNRYRFQAPQVYNGKVYEKNHSCFPTQEVIGRTVDKLCLTHGDEKSGLFQSISIQSKEKSPPFIHESETIRDALWLDLDVIDTTSLDTNIKGIRHSAFNANPILSHDLEEIIVSGERAVKRSGLMHRHGNIFSYCHAPSHVAF